MKFKDVRNGGLVVAAGGVAGWLYSYTQNPKDFPDIFNFYRDAVIGENIAAVGGLAYSAVKKDENLALGIASAWGLLYIGRSLLEIYENAQTKAAILANPATAPTMQP